MPPAPGCALGSSVASTQFRSRKYADDFAVFPPIPVLSHCHRLIRLTSSLFSPARLSSWFPSVDDIGALSGVLTGLLYTGFFSVCPFIFKAFANFGSGATSEDQAEFQAIRYYWFFVLATAFTGSSLATMITSGLYSGKIRSFTRRDDEQTRSFF